MQFCLGVLSVYAVCIKSKHMFQCIHLKGIKYNQCYNGVTDGFILPAYHSMNLCYYYVIYWWLYRINNMYVFKFNKLKCPE